jgi:cytochrome c-type biogenesis protein
LGNISLAVAFVAGLASFLSPCVVPLVPSYLSALAGTVIVGADARALRGRVLRNAIGFVIGFTAVLVSAGLLATGLGQFVHSHQRLLAELGGLLITVFGLDLLGVIHIGLLARQATFQQQRPGQGPLGALVLGIVFAAGWTPCIGPIAGSILALAAQARSVGTGGVLLLTYGMGLAVPFLVLAVLLDQAVPFVRRASRWLPLVSRLAGGLLVLLGVALLTGWYSRIPGFF